MEVGHTITIYPNGHRIVDIKYDNEFFKVEHAGDEWSITPLKPGNTNITFELERGNGKTFTMKCGVLIIP